VGHRWQFFHIGCSHDIRLGKRGQSPIRQFRALFPGPGQRFAQSVPVMGNRANDGKRDCPQDKAFSPAFFAVDAIFVPLPTGG
jgi:hypothetical protein